MLPERWRLVKHEKPIRLRNANMVITNTTVFHVRGGEHANIHELRTRVFYVRAVGYAIMKRFAITVVCVMVVELVRIATVVIVVKSVWGLLAANTASYAHLVRYVITQHTVIMGNYAVDVNRVEVDRVYVSMIGHVLLVVLVMVVIIVLMENDEVHALSVLTGTYALMERKKINVNYVDLISTVSTIK